MNDAGRTRAEAVSLVFQFCPVAESGRYLGPFAADIQPVFPVDNAVREVAARIGADLLRALDLGQQLGAAWRVLISISSRTRALLTALSCLARSVSVPP